MKKSKGKVVRKSNNVISVFKLTEISASVGFGILLLFLAIVFSVAFLSFQFIDPRNYLWIFGNHLPIRDDAGHAIASLFYAHQEHVTLNDIAKLTSFGGEPGGSLIYFAVSPLFAIPLKIVSFFFTPYLQFIGLQALLGLVGTCLALYLLCLRLGASALSSFSISAMSLFLPTTLYRSLNESLSMQFFVIFSLYLLARPKLGLPRNVAWLLLGFLSVAINMYFLPMVLAASFIEFLYLRVMSRNRLRDSIKSFLLTLLASIVSTAWFGGFKISPKSTGTDSSVLELFSSNLNTFIDSRGYGFSGNLSSQPSWESFNYLGVVPIVLIVYLSISKIKSNMQLKKLNNSADPKIVLTIKLRNKNLNKTIFYPLIIFAVTTFILSVGPSLQIGKSLSFDLHYPTQLISTLSTFRALGRFTWPMLYLLLVVSAFALDDLILRMKKHLKSDRNQIIILFMLVVSLVFIQFQDLKSLVHSVHTEIVVGSNDRNAFDGRIQKEFSSSKSIEVVPAYDGDTNGLPWREISQYALNADLPIKTWGFFARYDSKLAGQIQSKNFEKFINCDFNEGSIYIVRKSILGEISCSSNWEKIMDRNDWLVIKVTERNWR